MNRLTTFGESSTSQKAATKLYKMKIYSQQDTQGFPVAPSLQPKKLFYIDNIKLFLTVLVVLHHAFVTYGAPGGWYYTEKTSSLVGQILMTLFASINQAFFMGFFFFLSAYFIRSSYDAKGAKKFTANRFFRLGVPLLFYSFILSPVLSYIVNYFANGEHISLFRYLANFNSWIDFGVLWFIAALLIFTMQYVAVMRVNKKLLSAYLPKPTIGKVLVIAIAVAVLSFCVRLLFPVGWILHPLGFQPGHFAQYIVLFVLGILAANNNWLHHFSYKHNPWLFVFIIVLVLLFPVFYFLKVKLDFPATWFSGGFHWQSLLYSIWEQVTGFSIILLLLSIAKQRWNRTSAFLSKLSRNAFAVYIFHPLVLVSLSVAFKGLRIDPAIKLLLVAPLAVILSFGLTSILLRIKAVRRII
jgi:hypothetical protein